MEAGVRKDFTEEIEATLSKVLYRFSALDSRRWIQFLLNILPRLDDVDFAKLPPLGAADAANVLYDGVGQLCRGLEQ